ncbi:hypothetical protein DRJ25_02865, partial [Candidatus Woesearchaeota archaeon]
RISLKELKNFVPLKKLEEAMKIVEKSAKILNLNYTGADILFEGDDYQPIFLETNSFPGPYMAEDILNILYQKIKQNLFNDLKPINNHEMLNYISSDKI